MAVSRIQADATGLIRECGASSRPLELLAFEVNQFGYGLRRNSKLARATNQRLHVVDSKSLDLFPHDVGSSLNWSDESRIDRVEFGGFKFSCNQERVVDRHVSLAGFLLKVAERRGECSDGSAVRHVSREQVFTFAKLQEDGMVMVLHAHFKPKPGKVPAARESKREVHVDGGGAFFEANERLACFVHLLAPGKTFKMTLHLLFHKS